MLPPFRRLLAYDMTRSDVERGWAEVRKNRAGKKDPCVGSDVDTAFVVLDVAVKKKVHCVDKSDWVIDHSFEG